MLKNILNLILGLFGGAKKETAKNDWSSGDYERYADLKKQGKETHLAQNKPDSKSQNA